METEDTETICNYCSRKKCDRSFLTDLMNCDSMKWGEVILPVDREKYRKTVPIDQVRSLKSNVKWVD